MTLVNDATQRHATNEALAGAEARLKDHMATTIDQSEARMMRWTIIVGAFVIAATTIIDKVL